jgi:hypothetical protein
MKWMSGSTNYKAKRRLSPNPAVDHGAGLADHVEGPVRRVEHQRRREAVAARGQPELRGAVTGRLGAITSP